MAHALKLVPLALFIAVLSSPAAPRPVWAVGVDPIWEREDVAKNGLTCLVFSPDGRWIAQSAKGPVVHILRAQDGRLLHTLKWTENAFAICPLAFSPDGHLLAAARRKITLWDPRTGRRMSTLPGGEAVNSLAFSPDGQFLAAARNRRVEIWRVRDCQCVRSYSVPEGITGIIFCPADDVLAIRDTKGTVQLRRWEDGRLVGRLTGATGWGGWGNDMAFSPDGSMLASAGGADLTARLWRVKDGQPIQVFRGYVGPVDTVQFLAEGRILATTSRIGEVRLWRVADGWPLGDGRVPANGVAEPRMCPAAFSPEGSLLAYGQGWTRLVCRRWPGLPSGDFSRLTPAGD